jgi:hypothetical protein
MPTKKNYHKPPKDPRTIDGGLKEKGREGIVHSPSYRRFLGNFIPTARPAD